MIECIISGGQTGADRGGLDAAIAEGIEHGGWCPKGRRAEDGVIPERYQLTPTTTSSYPERTRMNVRKAHWTLIFVYGHVTRSRGSKLTWRIAKSAQVPAAWFDLQEEPHETTVRRVLAFLKGTHHKVINVAGNRESKAPGIQARVEAIMREVIQGARQL